MTIQDTAGSKMRVSARKAVTPDATVTVVIPCYNYGHYLTQAVDSALDQERAVVDVVIVDDKSTDDSLAVAQRLARLSPRVKVIANQVNSGMVATFNAGVAVASGEFLVRLDADDMLTPGALGRAVDVARAFPEVGLIYGHPLHFHGEELPEARQSANSWTVWPGRQWLRDRCRGGVNVVTSPEVVMRRSIVDIVGPQQPLHHTPDMEMWLRISAFSDVAYIHGADQAFHREHGASMSATEVDDFGDLVERKEAFETLFDGIAGSIPGARRLRNAAMDALANEALTVVNHEFDCGRGSGGLAADYARFAEELVADVHRLPAWRGYQRRLRLGSTRAGHPVTALPSRVTGALSRKIRWLRWHRTGSSNHEQFPQRPGAPGCPRRTAGSRRIPRTICPGTGAPGSSARGPRCRGARTAEALPKLGQRGFRFTAVCRGHRRLVQAHPPAGAGRRGQGELPHRMGLYAAFGRLGGTHDPLPHGSGDGRARPAMCSVSVRPSSRRLVPPMSR